MSNFNVFLISILVLSFYESLLRAEENEVLNAVLITVLYNETNEQRRNEFITCFEQNKKHEAIKQIHVIYDTSKDDPQNLLLTYLKHQKCAVSYISGRPTFGYCFELANKQYPDQVVIVSNADIFFNKTLNKLEGYDLANKFLAVTRWNVLENGQLEIFKQFKADSSFDEPMSQLSMDAWIFKTPLKAFVNPEFQLGTWACDGYIAYQAYISGLDVINPCLSIQCCHLHLSKIRHWIPQSIAGAKALRVPWAML